MYDSLSKIQQSLVFASRKTVSWRVDVLIAILFSLWDQKTADCQILLIMSAEFRIQLTTTWPTAGQSESKKKQEHVCNHVGILSSPRSSTLPLCILTWKWMGWLVYDTNFTALNWAPYWLPILSIFANMKAIFAHIHLSNIDPTKVCVRP